MPSYDFSTLNSSDLEELVCDLLNAHEKSINSGIIFKTFKDGKDKGIDIRFSTSTNSNEIVGQVKHYHKSGYGALLKVLKDVEKEKVMKLAPVRYIFATSVDLSVYNSEEIQRVFLPYIKSLHDIYGLKDLNRLLTSHTNVLYSHFKLWFSSTEVLQKVLNYQLEGRSHEFVEIELKKRLRLYVQTSAVNEALYLLRKNNFVIITGEPGSGKTTTAEILLYELIKEDYQLVYIYDDIKEAEKMIAKDDIKQVFYYDDFLGHNSVEIAKAKGSETALIKILKRINYLENKKFIFTTRTFILNSAIEDSEKLRHFNIKAKESNLRLSIYTDSIKLQILQNHVEECTLPSHLKEVLNSEEISSFIIQHKTFSPRSIEFITNIDNVGHFSRVEFENFIIKNFNAPDEIWRHAYEQQINNFDRFLLNTMVSFGSSVTIDQLERGFNKRLDYEVEYNNFERPISAFNKSFRRLEGGFIVEFSDFPGKYQFINPSLTDFLLKYIKCTVDESVRISESCYYLKQLTARLFPINSLDTKILRNHIPNQLKKKLLYDYKFFIKEETEDHDNLLLAIFLHKYISLNESEQVIVELLSSIRSSNIVVDDESIIYYLIYFLEEVTSTVIKNKIKDIEVYLFPPVLYSENDLNNLVKMIKLYINKYSIDIVQILHQNKNFDFREKFNSMLNEKIDIEVLLESSNANDIASNKELETQDFLDFFNSLNMRLNVNINEYNGYDWFQVSLDNQFNG